jgi:hypothetical protein
LLIGLLAAALSGGIATALLMLAACVIRLLCAALT